MVSAMPNQPSFQCHLNAASSELVLSRVEGLIQSRVEGPVLSQVEGPVLSRVEGMAVSPDPVIPNGVRNPPQHFLQDKALGIPRFITMTGTTHPFICG